MGVNYDEHGVGGHCHLYMASRLTSYAHAKCPSLLPNTVSRNGLCAKNDGITSRPLCNEGGLLQGVHPCVGGAGRTQSVGIFCFLSTDVGPSPGTGYAGCQLGEAYVADGNTANTLPTSTSACRKCVAGSYSVPKPDLRLERHVVPRPGDFPSTVNRCEQCPPGRHCGQERTPLHLTLTIITHPLPFTPCPLTTLLRTHPNPLVSLLSTPTNS